VRKEAMPPVFRHMPEDNFAYEKFSARYGNIYTVRHAAQLIERALGRFRPAEDRWIVASDRVIDPYRPGLKYPAMSSAEFDVLTASHLAAVIDVIREADVFIFTLGLTEAWVSRVDGAVFPACPGTVAGEFDPARHRFHNFTTAEVNEDLDRLIGLIREINPRLRVILSVSPVPLVATATPDHVVVATGYSKAVLRAAAGEAALRHSGITYFPAYEIVTGPQAPADYFDLDRREPSPQAIRAVMEAFLARCECGNGSRITEMALPQPPANSVIQQLSSFVVQVDCEEATAEGRV